MLGSHLPGAVCEAPRRISEDCGELPISREPCQIDGGIGTYDRHAASLAVVKIDDMAADGVHALEEENCSKTMTADLIGDIPSVFLHSYGS
jgi:hypothetical protein